MDDYSQLEIYSTSGKIISKEQLMVISQGKGKYKASSPTLNTNVSTLPNGLYFFRITVSNGVNKKSKTVKVAVVK